MLARMAQMAWASSQGAVFVSSAVGCLPTGYITSSLFATGPQQNSFFTTNDDDNDQIFRAIPTNPQHHMLRTQNPATRMLCHNHPQSIDPETQPNPTSTTSPQSAHPARPPAAPPTAATPLDSPGTWHET
jgi:hypothetical protein